MLENQDDIQEYQRNKIENDLIISNGMVNLNGMANFDENHVDICNSESKDSSILVETELLSTFDENKAYDIERESKHSSELLTRNFTNNINEINDINNKNYINDENEFKDIKYTKNNEIRNHELTIEENKSIETDNDISSIDEEDLQKIFFLEQGNLRLDDFRNEYIKFKKSRGKRRGHFLSILESSFIGKTINSLFNCIIDRNYNLYAGVYRERPAIFLYTPKAIIEIILILFQLIITLIPFALYFKWFSFLREENTNNESTSGSSNFFSQSNDVNILYIFCMISISPYFLLYLILRCLACIVWKIEIFIDLLQCMYHMIGSMLFVLISIMLWICRWSLSNDSHWIPSAPLLFISSFLALITSCNLIVFLLLVLIDLLIRRLYWRRLMYYPSTKERKRIMKEANYSILWKITVCLFPLWLIIESFIKKILKLVLKLIKKTIWKIRFEYIIYNSKHNKSNFHIRQSLQIEKNSTDVYLDKNSIDLKEENKKLLQEVFEDGKYEKSEKSNKSHASNTSNLSDVLKIKRIKEIEKDGLHNFLIHMNIQNSNLELSQNEDVQSSKVYNDVAVQAQLNRWNLSSIIPVISRKRQYQLDEFYNNHILLTNSSKTSQQDITENAYISSQEESSSINLDDIIYQPSKTNNLKTKTNINIQNNHQQENDLQKLHLETSEIQEISTTSFENIPHSISNPIPTPISISNPKSISYQSPETLRFQNNLSNLSISRIIVTKLEYELNNMNNNLNLQEQLHPNSLIEFYLNSETPIQTKENEIIELKHISSNNQNEYQSQESQNTQSNQQLNDFGIQPSTNDANDDILLQESINPILYNYNDNSEYVKSSQEKEDKNHLNLEKISTYNEPQLLTQREQISIHKEDYDSNFETTNQENKLNLIELDQVLSKEEHQLSNQINDQIMFNMNNNQQLTISSNKNPSNNQKINHQESNIKYLSSHCQNDNTMEQNSASPIKQSSNSNFLDSNIKAIEDISIKNDTEIAFEPIETIQEDEIELTDNLNYEEVEYFENFQMDTL